MASSGESKGAEPRWWGRKHNWKLEIGNWKLEIGNWKLEIGNPKRPSAETHPKSQEREAAPKRGGNPRKTRKTHHQKGLRPLWIPPPTGLRPFGFPDEIGGRYATLLLCPPNRRN
nr:MAG TPA: hypothetical protein [Caudoviricetes sp.]